MPKKGKGLTVRAGGESATSCEPGASPSPERVRMTFPKDAVSCKVCQEPFQVEEPKTPCVLPCFHTFCRRCIADWAVVDGEEGAQGAQGRKEVSYTCPTCRAPCTTQAKDLQINFALMNVVEATQVSSGKVVLSCHECEEEEAAHFCVECSVLLCTECSAHHVRKRSTKMHNLQTKKEFLERGGGLPRQPQACEKHKGQELRLFCLTCECVICQDCTIKDHREHEYDLIEDVAQKYADTLSGLADKADELKRVLEQGIVSIKAEEEALPEVDRENKEAIHKHFTGLAAVLRKQEENLFSKVSAERDRKQKVLAGQREGLENALARLESGSAHAWRTSSLGSFEMMQSYRSIAEGLRGLQGMEYELKPSTKANIKFVAQGAEQLSTQLAQHGIVACEEVRMLKYERPFQGGVLEHIATGGGKRAWSNPHDQGLVTVSWSSVEAGRVSLFVDGRTCQPQNCYTRSGHGSWMAVDLRLQLAPTYYCLRSSNLYNWRLEGSKDGRSWQTLKEHVHDDALRPSYGIHYPSCSVAAWPIEGFETTFFQHFRIVITGPNTDGYEYRVRCQGIELWGCLVEDQECQAEAPAPQASSAHVSAGAQNAKVQQRKKR